ncbi:hypothetical protein D3C81_1348930 [compost metagenome]
MASPTISAIEPPRAKPAAARITLASRWMNSFPFAASFTNCFPISQGVGRSEGESTPNAPATCHSSRTVNGKNQACRESGSLLASGAFS